MAVNNPPSTGGGGGLGATLRGRFAGMPTYVWLGVLVVAVVAFIIWRRHQLPTQPASTDAVGQVPSDQYAYLMGYPTGTPVPGPQGPPGAVTPSDPNPPVNPPNPAPAPTPPPTPVNPAPTPPPAPARTVTVCAWPSWCGSLWGIAAHFYNNGALWPRIYNANRNIIGPNPNLIHPGQVLVVP
jgi:LysM domain